MRKLFVTLTVIGLIATWAPHGSAKTTWNANSVWPPDNHQTTALEDFASKVKALTGGELEIVVKSGGALGYRGSELLKTVQDGLVPISDILISGVAGDERVFQVVTLPFLAHDFKEARLLNDVARPYFDKAARKRGQKILYVSPWPGAGLWTKNKIGAVADMKGLKTRAYDKNGALVIEAVGGAPFALPFSEIRSSLSYGLIDSVMTSTPTAVDTKFWEVFKFYLPLNVTIATDMVNVNLGAFDRLDKQTQEALVQAGKEVENAVWEKVAQLDKEQESLCNRNGIQTTPVPREMFDELSRVTEKIRADWLRDAPPDAGAIYEEYMKKVGR